MDRMLYHCIQLLRDCVSGLAVLSSLRLLRPLYLAILVVSSTLVDLFGGLAVGSDSGAASMTLPESNQVAVCNEGHEMYSIVTSGRAAGIQ